MKTRSHTPVPRSPPTGMDSIGFLRILLEIDFACADILPLNPGVSILQLSSPPRPSLAHIMLLFSLRRNYGFHIFKDYKKTKPNNNNKQPPQKKTKNPPKYATEVACGL